MKKNYELIKVHGREHVITEQSYNRTGYPDANYMGTGKCLCGVLEKGQTIEAWKLTNNK